MPPPCSFERGSFFLFDPNSWEVVRKDNFVVSLALLATPIAGCWRGAAGMGMGFGWLGERPGPSFWAKLCLHGCAFRCLISTVCVQVVASGPLAAAC